MKDLKAIASAINNMSHDLNAAVVIANLKDSGIDPHKIMVKHDGQFMRNFSKDVSDAYVDFVNNLLVIHIMRDSLYDSLPSGLFHHIFSDFSPDNRQIEFEKLKHEEENARKFFLPFDNEIFFQYVVLESELRRYFENPGTFLKELFLLEHNIPGEYTEKINSYLLYVDEIVGNPKVTASLLTEILGEEVNYSVQYISNNLARKENDHQFPVGKGLLGENYFCGDTPEEGRSVWTFTLVLKKDSPLEKFIGSDNSKLNAFLKLFYEYFIPLEIEVRTEIKCDYAIPFYLGHLQQMESEKKLKTEEEQYLGYNIMI